MAGVNKELLKLAPEELLELRQLQRSREWQVCLRLLKRLRALALQEVLNFSTPAQAVELRAKLKGIESVIETLEDLNREETDGDATHPGRSADDLDADYYAPRGPAY